MQPCPRSCWIVRIILREHCERRHQSLSRADNTKIHELNNLQKRGIGAAVLQSLSSFKWHQKLWDVLPVVRSNLKSVFTTSEDKQFFTWPRICWSLLEPMHNNKRLRTEGRKKGKTVGDYIEGKTYLDKMHPYPN